MKVPLEPKEIKRKIKIFAQELDGQRGESFAVWMFNLLPKYLWDNWKVELKAQGFDWKRFLRFLSNYTRDFADWALHGGDWGKLMQKIIKSLAKTRRLSNYF